MSRPPRHYLSAVPSVSAVRYYIQEDAELSDGELETHYTWTDSLGDQGAAATELQENMIGGTTPDVTELYRRKTEEHYMIPQEVVMAEEPRYYYRPAALSRLPQRRLPVGVTPSSAAMAGVAMAMQHPGSYYPPPLEEPRLEHRAHYESVYRSQPQLHRLMEGRPLAANSTGVVRRPHMFAESSLQMNSISRSTRPPAKPPVSVRTPRFIRRNIYKRPSTLCLQLPHTTDPSSRPPKTRLPSTLPLAVPPLNLRREQSTIATSYHNAQAAHTAHAQSLTTANTYLRHNALERARINALLDRKIGLMDRKYNSEDMRTLTTRSAPPTIDEDRSKKEEELDKVQRLILEHRGMAQDYGDECASEQLNSPDRDRPADSKCSELELLLSQYEQIFSGSNPEVLLSAPKSHNAIAASRKSSQKSRAKRKASIGKLTGLMKPKLPPSLKAGKKQVSNSKISLQPNPLSSAEEDRLEIEQMTAEVLDNLLQDLSTGGLAGNAVKVSSSSGSPSETRKNDEKVEQAQSMKNGRGDAARRCSRKSSRHCSRKSSRLHSRRASKNRSEKASLNSSGKESMSASRDESRTGSLQSRKESRKDSRKCSRKTSRRGSRVSSAKPRIEDCHDTERKDSKLSMRKSQTLYPEVKTYRDSPSPFETTFMQDKDKFKDYTNSSRTSFIQDKKSGDRFSKDNPSSSVEDNRESRSFKRVEGDSIGNNITKSSWESKDKKIEDHSALELHRSKSYIVNLIDRALSRELGTIPEERTSKQYLNLDARTAMDLIASKNMDSDMCMEITQAIAGSFSNINSKETQTASGTANKSSMSQPPCCSKIPDMAREETNRNRDEELVFSTGNDEPLYIKQLKKLRWGHLKHIQREMRRLEDLERFLDSCSSDK